MSVFGVRGCIVANILSFGATLIFSIKLRNMNELIVGPEKNNSLISFSIQGIFSTFWDSLKFVFNSKLFLPFTALMFFWQFSSMLPASPSMTFYFTEQQHFSPAEFGAVLSLVGVLAVIGYMGAHTLLSRFDFHQVFLGAALWQAALSTISILFYSHPLVLAVIFGVSRMGSSILTMGSFVLRQTMVPKEKIGRVNSCIRMLFMSAAPVSALVEAYLIKSFNVQISFVVGAVCLWIAFHFAKKVSVVITSMGQEHSDSEVIKKAA